MKWLRSRGGRRLFATACLALLVVAAPRLARGQAAIHEGFEGPDVAWRDAGADVDHRISVVRTSDRNIARSGDSCEYVQSLAGNGSFVYVAHPLREARVIDELKPSVWVRSNKTGVQVLVRVVLPRTLDPTTGKPITTLLRGTTTRTPGQWERLTVENVPQVLTQSLVTLQVKYGRGVRIDPSLAYVDQMVLNVYGGEGATDVWIDDLELTGVVARDDAGAPAMEEVVTPNLEDPRPNIHIDGGVMVLDGKPLFLRMIRYNGESLIYLKDLGFNAVFTPQPATAALLGEAEGAGMWIVAAPPLPASWRTHDTAMAPFGKLHDRVLCWYLGGGLRAAEVPLLKRLAQLVRLADGRMRRPLVCGAYEDLPAIARQVDVVLHDRQPLFTSLSLSDWRSALDRRVAQLRSGVASWTTVQTQPAAGLVEQWRVFGGAPPEAVAAQPEQIRALAFEAVSHASRGLLFESASPLDANEPSAKLRSQALKLVNLELDLIEPWAAAGRTSHEAGAGDPNIRAAVLIGSRTRVVAPVWIDPVGQYSVGQASVGDLKVLMPGAPESSEAYLVSPAGVQPLYRRKSASGAQIVLPEFDQAAEILLTHEPNILSSLRGRAGEIVQTAADLQREMAWRRFEEAQDAAWGLNRADRLPLQYERWLTAARAPLEAADRAFASNAFPEAYVAARRALRPMRLMTADVRAKALGDTEPLTTPLGASLATLPRHVDFLRSVESYTSGGNILATGHCDALDLMRVDGWIGEVRQQPGLHASLEVVREGARNGRGALRLSARPDAKAAPASLIETPLVWTTSPEMVAPPGSIVRIRGWVKIPEPLTATVDGLTITDSLGGEPLSLRFRHAPEWRPFVIYRAVTRGDRFHVAIALFGHGEAWVDDLVVEVLRSPDGAPNLLPSETLPPPSSSDELPPPLAEPLPAPLDGPQLFPEAPTR